MSIIPMFIRFTPMFLGEEKMESLKHTVFWILALFFYGNLFGLMIMSLAFFTAYFEQKSNIKLTYREDLSEQFDLKLFLLEGNSKMDFNEM